MTLFKDQDSGGWVWGHFAVLSTLPPGLWRVRVTAPGGGMMIRPGAELAFTDRAGVHWIRRAGGSLDEISAEGAEHYGLPGPFDFALPEPQL